ncbi:MAG TPA: hypothetical protein H9673_00665 [Candidatus Adamsella sp.]|nr:hypothetical protein [Candidatus Adamsella sp.]
MLESLFFKNKDKDLIIKSLNNYMEQLKLHFDLSEEEIDLIIKIVSKKRNNKKWWQFW